MIKTIAQLLFIILLFLNLFSCWLYSKYWFWGVQLILSLTFASWILVFEKSDALGLSLVFMLFLLNTNIKYLTNTKFLDFSYIRLSEFKKYCLV